MQTGAVTKHTKWQMRWRLASPEKPDKCSYESRIFSVGSRSTIHINPSKFRFSGWGTRERQWDRPQRVPGGAGHSRSTPWLWCDRLQAARTRQAWAGGAEPGPLLPELPQTTGFQGKAGQRPLSMVLRCSADPLHNVVGKSMVPRGQPPLSPCTEAAAWFSAHPMLQGGASASSFPPMRWVRGTLPSPTRYTDIFPWDYALTVTAKFHASRRTQRKSSRHPVVRGILNRHQEH